VLVQTGTALALRGNQVQQLRPNLVLQEHLSTLHLKTSLQQIESDLLVSWKLIEVIN
jgi:hypothetical protein